MDTKTTSFVERETALYQRVGSGTQDLNEALVSLDHTRDCLIAYRDITREAELSYDKLSPRSSDIDEAALHLAECIVANALVKARIEIADLIKTLESHLAEVIPIDEEGP